LSVFSQDYSNIEFIENKGQWDSRVKFKGEVNAGAVFVRSSGFTILQHNQQDYAALKALTHGHVNSTAGTAARPDGKLTVRSHAFNIDFVGASPNMQVIADKKIPTYNNYFLGNDARERIRILTATNNGFEIAEKDMELRGPGDIEGTRQSGMLNFKLANIVHDRPLLEIARSFVSAIIENDPDLLSAENLPIRNFLQQQKGKVAWSKIS